MDAQEILNVINQFVDYVQPELVPYETTFYVFLLRNSFLKNGTNEIRIGKRTISYNCGKGTRSDKANFQHVTKILKSLEDKGCIKILDTNMEGTLYKINLPKDIPFAVKKIRKTLPECEEDYFNDNEKRKEMFEKDKWLCQYCGEKVTQKTATLDHFIPQSKGGKHNKDNLRTCCMMCNSIKSGKTYEEVAALLLKNVKERRTKEHI